MNSPTPRHCKSEWCLVVDDYGYCLCECLECVQADEFLAARAEMEFRGHE